MITASALVLFMVPGLALFYGGMVNSKNVVNMLMMNVVTIPIATIIWVVVGFSLAFGASAGGLGIIGDLDKVGLAGLGDEETLFSVFQMMFAIITPALIAGAVAGRMKFSSWVIFAARVVSSHLSGGRPTGVSPVTGGCTHGAPGTSPEAWSSTSTRESPRWLSSRCWGPDRISEPNTPRIRFPSP